MRFSILAFAVAAAVVDAQAPVSQISDGQIQAPPSTYAPPASSVVVVPSSSVVVISTPVVVPSTPVVVPSSVILTTAPVVVPSSASGVIPSSIYGNSTIATLTPTTTPAGVSSAASAATPTGTGAAAVNAVGSLSFGAIALAGFFLA